MTGNETTNAYIYNKLLWQKATKQKVYILLPSQLLFGLATFMLIELV